MSLTLLLTSWLLIGSVPQPLQTTESLRHVSNVTQGKVFRGEWINTRVSVVMAVKVDNNWDIYQFDRDGTGLRRLTKTQGQVCDPDVSPDGRRVTFRLSTPNGDQVCVVDTSGKNFRQLTNDNRHNREPCWSPDGTSILFNRKGPSGQNDLYLMDTNSKKLRVFTSTGRWDADPDWSPDGKTIAFVRQYPGGFCLCLLDVKTKQVTRIDQEVNSYGAGYPRWSPDGRYVAYRGRFQNQDGLYLYDTKTKARRRIPPVGGVNTHAAWADANNLFFEKLEGAGRQQFIYRVDLRDKSLKPTPILCDGRTPEEWASRLANKAEVERAYVALRGMQSKRSALALAKVARKADSKTRKFALNVLRSFGGPMESAIPFLVSGLAKMDSQKQHDILMFLTRLGPRAAKATPALAKLLSSKEANTRQTSLRILHTIGPGAKESVPALVKILGQGNVSETHLALRILSRLGSAASAAIPAIRKLTTSNNSSVRSYARTVLQHIQRTN